MKRKIGTGMGKKRERGRGENGIGDRGGDLSRKTGRGRERERG